MRRECNGKELSILWLQAVLVLWPLFKGIGCVTVTEVRLLSDTGKSDYVLAGEGVIFSCLFILEPDEAIQSVIWEKDKEKVYVYDMERKRPTAMSVLKDHVDPRNDSPSTVVIINATKEMQGSYSCHVVTNLKTKSQNEAFLIIIVDACKENSWETHTDMISCTEDITFYCRGMYPKPSPVCGIYNDLTGSYIQSVPFDRVEKMGDGTYEISLFRRYHIRDWLDYPGHISFRCFIIVMSTTWRRGIHHKMFGEPGCSAQPPTPRNGHYNITEEKTCWRTPREGSRLTYGCQATYSLEGPDTMLCHNGTWQPVPNQEDTLQAVYAEKIEESDVQKATYCNYSPNHVLSTILETAVMITLFLFVIR